MRYIICFVGLHKVVGYSRTTCYNYPTGMIDFGCKYCCWKKK